MIGPRLHSRGSAGPELESGGSVWSPCCASTPLTSGHCGTGGHEGCLGTYLVGDFACVVLDGELGQWHLGFGVEWVGAMVVMALLQKCVVCGLGAGRLQWVGRGPGHPVLGLVADSPTPIDLQ